MTKLLMSINERKALAIIGGIASGKPHLAIKELNDNGLDAGARSLDILFDMISETLSVIDDGHGIFGEIPHDDFEKLLLTEDNPSELKVFDNPDNWESPFSLWSFQYMILHNAHSVKSLQNTYKWLVDTYVENGGNKPENIGVKGIGFLSCLFGCQRVEVISKPYLPIAKIHYNNKDLKKVPVFRLLYPDFENLTSDEVEPLIEEVKGKLINPATNQEMEHGTIVTMHGVAPGLTPDRIVRLLEQTFGLILQRTPIKMRLYVKQEQKQNLGKGRSMKVATSKTREITGFKLPLNYLVEENITSGDLSATVKLWLADKDSFPISFFQSGVRAGEVSSLEGMGQIWGNKNLTGIVEIAGSNTIWNTSKDLPNTMNKSVIGLINKLKSIEAKIASIYSDSLNSTRSREVRKILDFTARILGDVLASDENNIFSSAVALSDGSIYRGEKIREENKAKAKSKKNATKERSQTNYSTVFVIDEWGLPLPDNVGVSLSLKLTNKDQVLLSKQPTNGSVVLGELKAGSYRLHLQVPAGMTVVSPRPNPTEFEILRSLEPKVLRFVVKSNLTPRVKNKAPSLSILPKQMGSQNELVDGSSFITSGVIYINTDAEVFAEAYSDRDYQRLASAIAYPVMIAIGVSTATFDAYVADIVLKAAQRLEAQLILRFKEFLREKR